MKNAIAKYLPGKYLANQRKRLSPNSIFSYGSFWLECKSHVQKWIYYPLDWEMSVSDRKGSEWQDEHIPVYLGCIPIFDIISAFHLH